MAVRQVPETDPAGGIFSMRTKTRAWLLAAACTFAGTAAAQTPPAGPPPGAPVTVAAPNVRAGI